MKKKLKEIPEKLIIKGHITFSRYSFVVYFRRLLLNLNKNSYCFTHLEEPMDLELISLILKKTYKTVHKLIKEARAKKYITAVHYGRKFIYFANPYLFRFKGNRINKTVLIMFKEKN